MNLAAVFTQSLPGISPGIYDAADFKAVSDIVYARVGIVLPAGDAGLFAACPTGA
jgi:chemotaxis protein methyltransferase CheR